MILLFYFNGTWCIEAATERAAHSYKICIVKPNVNYFIYLGFVWCMHTILVLEVKMKKRQITRLH